MLTSSANQYLRPEYLTPLPTTLDAKKSPLALLAQTCNQIGADSPSTKSIIPPLEKSSKTSKSETPREKASPASSVGSCDVKSSFKPYDSSQRDKSSTPDERGGSTSSANRARTPVSAKSSSTTPGPSSNQRCGSNLSASSPRSSPAATGTKTPSSTSLQQNGESSSKSSAGDAPSTSPASKVGFSPSLLAATDPALKDIPLGTFKPVTSSYLGYPPTFPLDMASHLKPSLNPYISYARMKTPSGGDTLVPVCRDPYCTGCQLSAHLLGKTGACPGGCAQCDHATKGGFLPAAYAHAQLAALAAASHLPYVCNWIAGDAAYCGKRFASSEELLQHLRSHTAAADSLLFHRAYPTPPLSPRYHPYGKPPPLPPSLAFPLHHPGLPPYFSPYSLYGQRSAMHP